MSLACEPNLENLGSNGFDNPEKNTIINSKIKLDSSDNSGYRFHLQQGMSDNCVERASRSA